MVWNILTGIVEIVLAMGKVAKMERKITVEIPEALHNKLAQILTDSDFGSVQEFVVYVLNDLSTTGWPKEEKVSKEEISEEEMEKIKTRLRNLGYL